MGQKEGARLHRLQALWRGRTTRGTPTHSPAQPLNPDVQTQMFKLHMFKPSPLSLVVPTCSRKRARASSFQLLEHDLLLRRVLLVVDEPARVRILEELELLLDGLIWINCLC